MIEPDERWFRARATDPKRATHDWRKWMAMRHGKRSDGAKHRKALELATGLSRAAIGFYFARPTELSPQTRQRLEKLSKSLRAPVPDHGAVLSPAAARQARVMIVTELSAVPSPRFHLRLFAACARALHQKGIVCALHEIDPGDMARGVARIADGYRPAGAIFLRVSPSTETVKKLIRKNMPTVLIHADTHAYGPPVIANVIPDFDPLAEGLRIWARGLPNPKSEIVVATMPPETADSIRQLRFDAVMRGLNGHRVRPFPVVDYSFRHAFAVVAAHPKARGYVCLSDEIAVGVKKLLDRRRMATKGRVIGYDNSSFSHEENISSFDQQLDVAASLAVELLASWLRAPRTAARPWPDDTSVAAIPVAWVPRGG